MDGNQFSRSEGFRGQYETALSTFPAGPSKTKPKTEDLRQFE